MMEYSGFVKGMLLPIHYVGNGILSLDVYG